MLQSGKFDVDEHVGPPEPLQIDIIIPEQKIPKNFKIWTFLRANNVWRPVKNVNSWPVFQNLCRLLSD